MIEKDKIIALIEELQNSIEYDTSADEFIERLGTLKNNIEAIDNE